MGNCRRVATVAEQVRQAGFTVRFSFAGHFSWTRPEAVPGELGHPIDKGTGSASHYLGAALFLALAGRINCVWRRGIFCASHFHKRSRPNHTRRDRFISMGGGRQAAGGIPQGNAFRFLV